MFESKWSKNCCIDSQLISDDCLDKERSVGGSKLQSLGYEPSCWHRNRFCAINSAKWLGHMCLIT